VFLIIQEKHVEIDKFGVGYILNLSILVGCYFVSFWFLIGLIDTTVFDAKMWGIFTVTACKTKDPD